MSTNAFQYAVRTHSLTRHFGEVRAVEDLTIEVPRGIVFGFLGPNGSGKTTTIRLLLGLLEPTGGRAEVLGLDIAKQADQVRNRCGALLEYNGLYERMSAEDNLEFYARVWHLSPTTRRARIQELLTHTGLWERRKDLVGSWSRGMKQKLAVARALIHRPELVFLDEPTSGLDPVAAMALREDLATLASQEGVTVFLTTHNLSEAEKLCRQVGVIRGGRLLAVGPLDQLRAGSRGPRLEFVGEGFQASIQALKLHPEVSDVQLQGNTLIIRLRTHVEAAPFVSLLVKNGAQVEEVHKGQASLEEVFMDLMNENQTMEEFEG